MRVGRGSACKMAGELRWGCKLSQKGTGSVTQRAEDAAVLDTVE